MLNPRKYVKGFLTRLQAGAGILPSSSSPQQARRRRHGQRGVTALEFALVAPMVFLVLFFVIEIGIMLMADATLGRVANHIARQGRLNKLSSANCTASVRTLLEDGMRGWGKDFIVDVKVYSPSDSVSVNASVFNENYTPTCTLGTENSLMVYRIGFQSSGFTGIIRWLSVDDFRFERTIILQNEPWS